MDLTALSCLLDDFCQSLPQPKALGYHDGRWRRQRQGLMTLSERLCLMVAFHQSHYRNFKAWHRLVSQIYRCEFPTLLSYSYERFVGLMPSLAMPLAVLLHQCRGPCSGVSFVDSTALAVCHPKRISRHRVFHGIAARGKTTKGWFYGFKLHLAVNDRGELLAFQLNTDDRTPLPTLAKSLWGKLFADKGYISRALFTQLWEQNLHLVTSIRSNMKNRLVDVWDKLLLPKRSLIETIIDQLKNISQIEHSRHRSPANFLVNLLAGLLACCFHPAKPSLNLFSVPSA